MNVVFRADAGVAIGSGHVTRCLTLANRLREYGASSTFLSRRLDEKLAARIHDSGHSVIDFDFPEPRRSPAATEAVWTADQQRADATEFKKAVGGQTFDWLVVDHYGLEIAWESEFSQVVPRIMVIDDLANREHVCGLLLDQNLGRHAADYDGLVAPDVPLLVGPDYALLRPEFADFRATRTRVDYGAGIRLLISFGGSDPENHTARTLRELQAVGVPPTMAITVVLGSLSPHVDEVKAIARTMPVPTEVVNNVTDMAALMASCNLAIGAAGATAWERCCLGLPSLIVAIAENQRSGAEALAKSGAAITALNSIADFDLGRILQSQNSSVLANMSDRALSVCDGQGAQRVCEAMYARQ